MILPLLLIFLSPQATGIAVPAGQHIILTAQGRGFQIYRCTQPAVDTPPKWTLFAPQADLFSNERKIGTHDAGPSWHNQDGSTVQGTVIGTQASTDLASIPQLLLQTKSTSGQGLFTTVTYIQRTGTQGGIAPQSGCDAAHLQQIVKIPYQATYTFFAPDHLPQH